MIKDIFKMIYKFIVLRKRYLTNFWLPNLFNKNGLFVENSPLFIQKTLITGSGKVLIGSGSAFGFKTGGRYRYGYIELQTRTQDSIIKIGENVSFNNNIFICAMNKIDIGSDTLIGENVTMMDFEAHGILPEKRQEVGDIGQITIERNVWIGNNVVLLKNSFIGENSIVAAGAVVTGKFPQNVIIGGVPAKIIKQINVKRKLI